MKYIQLVVGPAGSGKSSYCAAVAEHYRMQKRRVALVNLDPAAGEDLGYSADCDIRDLISTEDIRECEDSSLSKLGPNGALMYCMDYLMHNEEWLRESLSEATGNRDDSMVIVDSPGQIELSSSCSALPKIIKSLQMIHDSRVCVVFLLDACFISDASKYIAGMLSALTSMLHFDECAHLTLLSKVDLLGHPQHRASPKSDSASAVSVEASEDEITEEEYQIWQQWCEPDLTSLQRSLQCSGSSKRSKLDAALIDLLSSFGSVSMMPFSVVREKLVQNCTVHIDQVLDCSQDIEPKETV